MTDIPQYPAAKKDLFDQIAAARVKLEQITAGLSDAEFSAGSAPLDWSVKDHLAHLGAWTIGTVALLQRRSIWQAMNLKDDFGQQAEVDEINDVLYHRHKDRTPAEVRAYFDDCHRQLVDAISRLDYADLLQPFSHYQPHRNPASGTDPVIDWVVNNSYDHYREHLPWIQAKIDRIRL